MAILNSTDSFAFLFFIMTLGCQSLLFTINRCIGIFLSHTDVDLPVSVVYTNRFICSFFFFLIQRLTCQSFSSRFNRFTCTVLSLVFTLLCQPLLPRFFTFSFSHIHVGKSTIFPLCLLLHLNTFPFCKQAVLVYL